MSRKTTTYARKRANRNPAHEKARGITALYGATARCQTYGENSFYKPETLLLKVRMALQGLIDRTVPSDDTYSHDELAHAIGEAEIRYIEIAGQDNNPALPILYKAGNALLRTRERWNRTGQWGLDGPAMQELKDGVDLYEQVLLASTPQQMHDAAMTRWKWLEEQYKDTALRERTEKRFREAVAAA